MTMPCRLEPVERRFVAAPFSGTLQRSCVSPGDSVVQGQLLAVLDGRELRWEIAGLEAEYGRVEKQRDVALARQESAAALQAQLELQRIASKRTLLTHRVEHLEIRSPMDGVVVAGDLSKAQFAPVETGQKLFEVAPLGAMVVEVAVPESDIGCVAEGHEARLTVDAFPRESWTGAIGRIRPRAEQKDGVTAFIAEVPLENAGTSLRPGMSGRARITGDHRSVAWIWFHKPMEALLRLLGC